jgi:dTDP-L-rhamnose 4-epimerase
MKRKDLALVTGGAGFIGSHLVDALINQGYRVRVLDNLAPPTHNGKLPDWFNKKAQFVKGDVRLKKDWLKALRDVSYVFHLAAYMDYHPDFSAYIDTNTKSAALLYELIVEKKLPVKKVVVASSQSVYGEGKYYCVKHGIFYPEARPEAQLKKHQWEVICPQDQKPAKILPEKETDQLNPQIPYGISKQALEKLILALGKIYQIPSVVLRFSIVQGGRQSFRHFYSGALRDFSVRALAGLPMAMQEDGRQNRDFVSVHDVISAHLKVLHDSRADYEIFNVGRGKATRVRELAKKVCLAVGAPYRPHFSGVFRINAPRHSIMDISKLKKLGWRPEHSLEDNVREYMHFIKKHPEAIKFLLKTYRDMDKAKILKM